MTCFYVNSYIKYTRWGNDCELSFTPYCYYYCMKQPRKNVTKRRSRFGDIFKGQSPNLEDMVFYQKMMKKNKNKKHRLAKSREKGGSGLDGQGGKAGMGGEGDSADGDGTKGNVGGKSKEGSGRKHGRKEGEEGRDGTGTENSGKSKETDAENRNSGGKGKKINTADKENNTDSGGGMGDGKIIGGVSGEGLKDQYGGAGTAGGWGEGGQGMISGKDQGTNGMVGNAPWCPSNGVVGTGVNINSAGDGSGEGIGTGYGTRITGVGHEGNGGFGVGVGFGAAGWPEGAPAGWAGAASGGRSQGSTGAWPGGVPGAWPGNVPGVWPGGVPKTWNGGVQGSWPGNVSGGWPGGVSGGIRGGAAGMPFSGMSGYTGLRYSGVMGPAGPAGEGSNMYGIGGGNVYMPKQIRPCPQVCTPKPGNGKQNESLIHQRFFQDRTQHILRQNTTTPQNFGVIQQPYTYAPANCLQKHSGLSSVPIRQQNYPQYYNQQQNYYAEFPQKYAPMQKLPSSPLQYNPQIYGGIQGAPISQYCNPQYCDTYQTHQQIPQYCSMQMRNNYAQQYHQYLHNNQSMFGQFGRTPINGNMICTPNTNFSQVYRNPAGHATAPPAIFAHYMHDIGDFQCNRCATSFSTNHLIKCKTCGQVIF